ALIPPRRRGQGCNGAFEPGVCFMAERRAVSLDGIAAGFVAVGAVLALSLLGQEPDGGNWLAALQTAAFGAAAPLVLVAWALLAWHLIFRRRWLRWGARLVGWAVLLPCAAVVLDRQDVELSGAPLTGPGGAVGAGLSLVLEDSCAPFGQVLLLAAGTLIGTVLAVDFLALPGLRWAGVGLRRGLRLLLVIRSRWSAKRAE